MIGRSPDSPDRFCRGCGQTLVPGARFCAGCGTPAPAAAPSAMAQPYSPGMTTQMVPPPWAAQMPGSMVAQKKGGGCLLNLIIFFVVGIPCLLASIVMPALILVDLALAVLLWWRGARISAVLLALLTFFAARIGSEIAPYTAQLTPYLQDERTRQQILQILSQVISNGGTPR